MALLFFFRNCNGNVLHFLNNNNEFNSYFYHYFLHFEFNCDIIFVYSIFSFQLTLLCYI